MAQKNLLGVGRRVRESDVKGRSCCFILPHHNLEIMMKQIKVYVYFIALKFIGIYYEFICKIAQAE